MEEHQIACTRCREQTLDSDLVSVQGHPGEVCPACRDWWEAHQDEKPTVPDGLLWRRRCDDCGDWWDAHLVAITPSGRECCTACTPPHFRKRAESALDAMVVLSKFLALANDLERGWLTSMLKPGCSQPPPDDPINYSNHITNELIEMSYKV